MHCQNCKGICQKAVRQRNGAQKLYCVKCKKYQQEGYKNTAYESGIDTLITSLVCEEVGIRGIARVVRIAAGTVLSRIRKIASTVLRLSVAEEGATFEVDEL